MEEYSPSSSSLNTTAYQHSAPHQDTPLSAAIDNSDSSSDLSSLEDEDEEGDTTMVDRMDRTDLDSTSPSSIRFIEDTLISKTCPLRSSSPDLPIAQLVVSRSAHSPPPRTPSLLSTSDKSMTLPSLNTLQAIPSRTSTKRKRSPPSSSSSSTTIAPDTDGGPAVPDQQFATVCTVTSLKATSEINQLDCLPCQSTPYAASIDEVKEGDPYELVVLASPLTTGQGNFQIPPSSSKSGSFQTTMSLLQSTPMTKKTKRTLRQPFTLIAEEEISQRKTRDKSLSSVSLRTLPPKKAKRGTDQISSITSSTPIFADDDEAATNSSANLSFSTDKIDQDKSTKKLVCEEACDTSTVPESVYISRKQNHRMSRTTNASIVHDLIDTATRINTSQSNNQKEMVNNSLVIDKENHDTVADQDKGNKEEENEARDHGRDVDVDGESGDNPKNMKISRPKGRSRGNKRFDQILLEYISSHPESKSVAWSNCGTYIIIYDTEGLRNELNAGGYTQQSSFASLKKQLVNYRFLKAPPNEIRELELDVSLKPEEIAKLFVCKHFKYRKGDQVDRTSASTQLTQANNPSSTFEESSKSSSTTCKENSPPPPPSPPSSTISKPNVPPKLEADNDVNDPELSMPLNEKQSESKKRPGTWSMNWSNSIQGRKKKLKTDHHYAQKASELNADADTLSPLATGSTAGAGGQVEETVLSEKTKPRDSGYNPSKSQKMYNLAMKSELLKRGKSLSVSPSRPLHSARYTPSSPHRTIAQAFLSPRRSRVQTKCTSSSITASPNGDQKNTAEYRRSLPRVAKGSPLRSTSLVAKNYKHVKPSYTSEYAYYNSQIKVVVDTDGKEEQLERNDSTGSTSYAMNDGTSSRTLRALKRARSPDFSFEIKKELVEVAVSELGTAEKYNGNEGRQDNQSEEEEKNTSFSLENNSNSSFRADSPIYELKSKSKREGDAKERCINSDLVDVIESVKRDDGIIVDAEEHIVLQNDRQELNTPCSGALERQLPSCGILDYASPLTELSDEPSEDSQELKNDSSRSRAIDDPVSSGTVPPVQDDLLSLVHPSTPKREGADDLSNRRDRLVSSEPCAYNALLASSLLGIKAAACALRTLAVQNENREMDLELYTNNLDQNDMRDKEGSPSSISSRHHSRSLSTSTSPTSVDEHQTEAEIEVGEDESKSCQNDQIGDEPVPDPTMKVPTVQIDSPSNGGLIDSTFDDVREAIDHAISKAAPRASKSNSSGFLHPRSAPAPVSRTTQAVLSSKIEAGLSTTAEYDENEEDLADSLFRINMPSPRMISASLPGNTPPNRSSSSSNTNVQHSGLERSDSVESVLWSRSTALQAENAILKFRGKECCLIPEREDLTQTKLSYHNYNSSLDVSLIKQSIGNNKNSFEVHPPTPEKWKEYERLTPDDYVNYDLPLLSKMTFSTSLISSAGVIADYGNRYMEPILSVYREGGISVIEESPTASPSDMVFSP